MISLKEGVSLRNIHKWQIVFAVIFSCLMIFSTYRLINSFMRVKNASEENLMLQNSVHGLMDASDHLTEMVQRFTESGDRRFMEQYFIEAFATKRREQAITELKRVKNVGPALASLEEAMRYSVKLMDREYYAMRLVIEAKGIREYPSVLKGVTLNSADMALSPEDKMRRATKMVLDGEYYTQKNRIRAEVNNTVQAIVSQAQKEETDALERFQKELNLARAGVLMIIASIFFVVWLTSTLGINPILRAVDQIETDSPIRETGANEFRYLAKAYNNLYFMYKKSIEHLNFKASHDELTGAYNRAGFDLLLSSLDLDSTYLMMLDVDNFKTINDNTAQCDLTFHNDTLAADLTASVSLERLDSKRWRIISVTEFQSFLKQTQTAYEKKLAALNKPIQDKIDGALRIENLKAELIHNNTASPAFTYIRLHYMMKQQGQLNDIKGIRLHYELHDQQDGSLLYQANTIFVPTGQFGQRTSQFTISPLRRGYYALAQRPDLSQTTSALTITAIYFKDGTNWQLETVLPN